MAVEQTQQKENALMRYFRETRAELRKVHWPTRKETLRMTGIVLAVTLAMAFFLGILDLFFGWLLKGVVETGPAFLIASIVVGLALIGTAYYISRKKEEG